MKILLDENLPHDLRHFLSGHEVFTVAYMGWSGVENGELLKLAGDNSFDVMLTMDSGVEYERPLATLPVAVIVMNAKTNKLDDLRPLLPAVLSALTNLQPKKLVRVG
jgi:predicted nuclease of predicted toxin-antitoxin system